MYLDIPIWQSKNEIGLSIIAYVPLIKPLTARMVSADTTNMVSSFPRVFVVKPAASPIDAMNRVSTKAKQPDPSEASG